jgi:hypothetical protein
MREIRGEFSLCVKYTLITNKHTYTSHKTTNTHNVAQMRDNPREIFRVLGARVSRHI